MLFGKKKKRIMKSFDVITMYVAADDLSLTLKFSLKFMTFFISLYFILNTVAVSKGKS